ncbi:MAG: 23S rRNA (uracil(1939)-C(5))-methyltransferase RlmD [Chloroflexales bacterium]|nr:23S rRNA (uracil(1939)-C(5))-methyltransferase RlmD [Chloroflexales bacterium]
MYPDEVEITIDDIAQGGDGVGRWEGRVIFARGALPGERVRVAIRERRSDFAKGDVIAVLEASPDRVEPRMPTGGDHMPWQHIAYDAQLRFKRQILTEQLAKIGGIRDVAVDEMIASPRPWGYRNTAHFNVQGRNVGYYAAGSRAIVPLRHDPLLLPELNTSLAALYDMLATSIREDNLRHVTLRSSAAYGYVVGILDGGDDLAGTAWRWRTRDPNLAGVLYPEPEDPEGAYAVEGASTLNEEFGGLAFQLDPQSFFQVNAPQAEQLLRLLREGLDLQPGQRLLDAYSGVGAFALPLAAAVEEVVAVEENPGAVEDGRASAIFNNIRNVTFVTGQVERKLLTLDGSFDGAILDPPRRGCHPAALEGLRALAPQRIAYVACSPGILARDLKALLAPSEQGPSYVLRSVRPVDMFPQTPHIECVAILEQV